MVLQVFLRGSVSEALHLEGGLRLVAWGTGSPVMLDVFLSHHQPDAWVVWLRLQLSSCIFLLSQPLKFRSHSSMHSFLNLEQLLAAILFRLYFPSSLSSWVGNFYSCSLQDLKCRLPFTGIFLKPQPRMLTALAPLLLCVSVV